MVRFLLQVPGVRQLHDRQLLFPLLVIGMVAAVLTHGALEVRPAAGTDGDTGGDVAEAVVAEAPDPPRRAGTRPALRGDLEKTPLTYFPDYWGQLLSHAGVHLIAVGSEMHAGIVMEPGVAVVTAAAAELSAAAERVRLSREMAADTEAPESTGAAAASTDESADPTDGVLAVDRMSGLALVAAPPDVAAFETGSARALPSGSYVGSVTLDVAGTPAIAPGFLVSAPDVTEGADDRDEGDLVVSAAPPRDAAVAAVVDLDGALIGISYRGPDGVRTLSVEVLGDVVDRMQRGEPCQAISVAAPGLDVVELLRAGGLLIESVEAEAFASEPRLRPGDVLIAWNGEAVDSVEDFEARYDAAVAGERVSYRVLRGRRRVSGRTFMPDAACRPVSPLGVVRLAGLGVVVTWDAAAGDTGGAWTLSTVVPDGPAGAAGIEEGDVLLSVDGRAVGRAGRRSELDSLAGADRPLLISLRRQDRVLLVALVPPVSQ